VWPNVRYHQLQSTRVDTDASRTRKRKERRETASGRRTRGCPDEVADWKKDQQLRTGRRDENLANLNEPSSKKTKSRIYIINVPCTPRRQHNLGTALQLYSSKDPKVCIFDF
jgi:hypothetical protein